MGRVEGRKKALGKPRYTLKRALWSHWAQARDLPWLSEGAGLPFFLSVLLLQDEFGG